MPRTLLAAVWETTMSETWFPPSGHLPVWSGDKIWTEPGQRLHYWMRSQSLESEWHKNVEVPAVTGFVMGGGLQCVELLDSKVVWKAGDCNRIRLMTGEKRARGKARGSEVSCVFWEESACDGAPDSRPYVMRRGKGRSTFRLDLKHCYQGYLSVSQRYLDIYLDDIRESFQVLKQNIDLIKAIGEFKCGR